MAKQGDVHVVHRQDQGKWAVEVEGGRAPHMRRRPKPSVLGREDGKITERNTYGHDPRRTKG